MKICVLTPYNPLAALLQVLLGVSQPLVAMLLDPAPCVIGPSPGVCGLHVEPRQAVVPSYQGFQRVHDALVAFQDLGPLVLRQGLAAACGWRVKVGHNKANGKRRCVDLVSNPVDRGVPVQYYNVVIMEPAVGVVGGEHQLEEAEVGEAVGRDDVSQELKSSKTLIWVVFYNPGGVGACDIGFKFDSRQGPELRRVEIVNDKPVAREEDKLGIPA